MAKKNTLTAAENSMLKKMFWYSHLVFVNFTMAKMEANCFTMSMAPAIEEIYGDDKEAKGQAYVRHNAFFNTHAVALDFILGIAAAMEKDVAAGKIPGSTVDAIKASLMGPTAGMFDSIFFNCLRVIAAGIAIGLCQTGNPLGILIFILLYGVTQSIAKWLLLKLGYSMGLSFIDTVFNSGLIAHATQAASILGLMMVGAMTATTVNVPLNWIITIGGGENPATVNILSLFDAVYPGILSLGIVLLMMWLIKKKGAKPLTLILGLMVVGLLGALVGIF